MIPQIHRILAINLSKTSNFVVLQRSWIFKKRNQNPVKHLRKWFFFGKIVNNWKSWTIFTKKLHPRCSSYYIALLLATKTIITFCITPLNILQCQFYITSVYLRILLTTTRITHIINSTSDRQEAPIIRPTNPPISPNIWTSGYILSLLWLHTLRDVDKIAKTGILKTPACCFRVSLYNKDYYPFPVLQY